MVHWNWIVFTIVVGYLINKMRISSKESGGDYSFDFETPFWQIVLIAYILIWGGIFWW